MIFEKKTLLESPKRDVSDTLLSPETLELASPVQPYKGHSENKKFFDFPLHFRLLSILILFLMMFGFQSPQILPRVQWIQLRALGAFEVRHNSEWQMLPYDFYYFLKEREERIHLKFRTGQGVKHKWLNISEGWQTQAHIFNMDTL